MSGPAEWNNHEESLTPCQATHCHESLGFSLHARTRIDGQRQEGALTTEEQEELRRLRRECRRLTWERDFSRTGRGLLRQGMRLAYALIAVENASYPVSTMCRMLEVSWSGLYASQRRPRATPREDNNAELLERIWAVHGVIRGTHGAVRESTRRRCATDIQGRRVASNGGGAFDHVTRAGLDRPPCFPGNRGCGEANQKPVRRATPEVPHLRQGRHDVGISTELKALMVKHGRGPL